MNREDWRAIPYGLAAFGIMVAFYIVAAIYGGAL